MKNIERELAVVKKKLAANSGPAHFENFKSQISDFKYLKSEILDLKSVVATAFLMRRFFRWCGASECRLESGGDAIEIVRCVLQKIALAKEKWGYCLAIGQVMQASPQAQ